jgi:hypothetical protein
MLVADVLTLWMHWDVQQRLREHDAKYGAPPDNLDP